MSYTFGGGTGDDITTSASHATGGTGQICLSVGYYYPTTLTSGRYYNSCGNTYGLSVAPTTSELRLTTDNTTDGVWTTTGAGMATNAWRGISCMSNHFNTGPAAAVRVWVFDQHTPPTECTITNTTSPSGNFTGQASRTVGNRGTGTVAFQGDIGWVSFITCNNATQTTNPFGTSANGAITQAEADYVKNKYVVPLAYGQPIPRPTGFLTGAFSIIHFPFMQGGVVYQYSDDPAPNSVINPTINGATFTHNTPPFSPPPDWPLMLR